MVEKILFNISKKVISTYFFLGAGPGGNNCKEGAKIMPYYPFLKIVLNFLFKPLKPALQNLDNNVCFLEIGEKYENIKLSCDWCSICNGIMATAKQNIITDPKLLKEVDFKKLKFIDKYLDFVLVDRTEKIQTEKIEDWCQTTFGTTTTDLLLLSRMYLKLEMIELRWCPFKRSKEFYYRNTDERYLEPTKKIIYELGEILSKYETVNCNNCPKLINENWKYTKSNTESIFQPLLDYMMKEINKS